MTAITTTLNCFKNLHCDCKIKDTVPKELCDGQISTKWLLNIMIKADCQVKKLCHKCKIEKITFTRLGVGSAFNSTIYRVKISFEGSPVFSLIVKIPCCSITAEGGLVMPKTTFMGHNKEVEFYNIFKDVELNTIPKCYFGRKTGEKEQAILLIEDLGAEVITPSMYQPCRREQVFKVAEELARFQAKVSKLPKNSWSHFEDYFHTLEVHTVLNPVCTPANVEYDSNLKPLLDELQPVSNEKFARYACLERPGELGAITLCHGDVWNGNMFFYRDATKEIGISNNLRAFVDFQTVFGGNMFLDIARYVVLCARGEVRRSVHNEIVGHFLRCLKKAFKEEGVEYKYNFDEKEAQELYDLCVVQQAIVNIMIIPYFSPNADGAPEETHKIRMAELHQRMKEMFIDAAEIMRKYGWDKL
ncbi:unnamed protein product [Bursaphelenchus xylophilus]|uniref:(pine wood nematode) hypothetical protein n=1 Tax=Bursaphelenchus xylophilus TaxID=6326 RepID=A0A1I7RUX5_BURXY|nr:unnamed protein product [Bursaphelenchus xylophilus]CAG9105337.1 unnamed protein product [Bursaphelenchus xylophilus]